MTSYMAVEIPLWGGLGPSIKEDVVEAVGFQVLAHPSMAEGAPQAAQTFFAQLCTCKTTRNLYNMIHMHRYSPPKSDYPRQYFNPLEYSIREVVVYKRRFFLQHEGFLFRVHHRPIGQHLPEPDFIIAIDRSVDATAWNPLNLSRKFVIDAVHCFLYPADPAPRQIKETLSRPIMWRLPAPGNQINFDLCQLAVLLDAVSFSYPKNQYNALHKNCFSHSRILRGVIIRIIQEQQPGTIVTAVESPRFLLKLGTCFGIHLDRDQGEEAKIFDNYQILYTQFSG